MEVLINTVAEPSVAGKLLESFLGGQPLSASLVFLGAGVTLVFLIQFVNDLIALITKKEPSALLKKVVTTLVAMAVSTLTVIVLDVQFTIAQMMFWTVTISGLFYKAYMREKFSQLELSPSAVVEKVTTVPEPLG